MAHVKIRNRKTGGVWLCPERVVEHFLSNGWIKAAESADTTDEQPAAAARKSKEK